MNGFLVPANAKKGTLILNLFLPFDIILFGSGIFISLMLLAFSDNTTDTLTVILISLPALITGLLVMPIPNYHNVRVAIISIYRFFTGRRRYVWKGWCFYERFAQESVATKDAKGKF